VAKMPAPPQIRPPIRDLKEVEDIINSILRYLDQLRQEVEKATFTEVIRNEATSALTLTTTDQDIPGATITLPSTGQWWILGVVDFQSVGAGDDGFVGVGVLDFAGAAQASQVIYQFNTNQRATASQSWIVSAAANDIVKLRGRKTGGTGTSRSNPGHTTITAIRIKA